MASRSSKKPAESPVSGEEELSRISVVFRASAVKPSVMHLAFDPRTSPVAEAVEKGNYDLVVLGTENRAVQHRLFFGYDNERLIRAARVPVVVVVPNVSRLASADLPVFEVVEAGILAKRLEHLLARCSLVALVREHDHLIPAHP